ncbi:unnamed protein product [Microthlaspi erraticum]|uniref:Uncharacterized protein n=1 Tax=Microthlaspi erraticum TaxID=1685480 RepID=A0A6D2KWI6_9BRAS|nr:unnamed protein product [Microthlaspi erraticum]
MEVHQGIRNARLQGDYSDYALTEPCSLRSTDFPSGMVADDLSKDVQGELWSHGPTRGESRQNGAQRSSIVSPQSRSTQSQRSIDSSSHHKLDRSHASEPARSISFGLSRRSIPFGLSRSIRPAQMISQPFDLLGANRLDRTVANRIEPKLDPELFRPTLAIV